MITHSGVSIHRLQKTLRGEGKVSRSSVYSECVSLRQIRSPLGGSVKALSGSTEPMQIHSRLRDTTLGDLLAQLHRNNASGVLELLESRSRHAIHLRRGYVQAVESECATLRLGDVATRRWGIGRISVERARMYAHSKGIKIGQALVALHIIEANQLDALLAEQQRARLDMLYSLNDAELRFRVSRPLPLGAAEQSPLGVRDTYYGRPRKYPRVHEKAGPQSTQDTHQRATTNASHMRYTLHPMAQEYALLGIATDADSTAIRKAFRELVLQLHPDRAQQLSEKERDARAQRLVTVIRAYRTIMAESN